MDMNLWTAPLDHVRHFRPLGLLPNMVGIYKRARLAGRALGSL
jgi:hypothetical protein